MVANHVVVTLHHGCPLTISHSNSPRVDDTSQSHKDQVMKVSFVLGTRTNQDGSRWIVAAVPYHKYNNHLRKEGVDEEVGRV